MLPSLRDIRREGENPADAGAKICSRRGNKTNEKVRRMERPEEMEWGRDPGRQEVVGDSVILTSAYVCVRKHVQNVKLVVF